MTIDAHAHAFPDGLAQKAIGVLNEGVAEEARAVLDGTVADLLRSMARAGIGRAVLCNIATRPGQVDAIIEWSLGVETDRLVPLGSVHPRCADPAGEVRKVARAGLKGIKLHPLYQEFSVDDRRMWPLYEAVQETGLVLTLHAGRDIAFPPEDDRAAPRRILRVHEAFPRIPMVAAHMGGWKMWGEVAETLAGTELYLETSYTFDTGAPETLRRIIERHSPERILFGTDSPWRDQAETLELVREAFPDPAVRRAVLHRNAARLYGLPSGTPA